MSGMFFETECIIDRRIMLQYAHRTT